MRPDFSLVVVLSFSRVPRCPFHSARGNHGCDVEQFPASSDITNLITQTPRPKLICSPSTAACNTIQEPAWRPTATRGAAQVGDVAATTRVVAAGTTIMVEVEAAEQQATEEAQVHLLRARDGATVPLPALPPATARHLMVSSTGTFQVLGLPSTPTTATAKPPTSAALQPAPTTTSSRLPSHRSPPATPKTTCTSSCMIE